MLTVWGMFNRYVRHEHYIAQYQHYTSKHNWEPLTIVYMTNCAAQLSNDLLKLWNTWVMDFEYFHPELWHIAGSCVCHWPARGTDDGRVVFRFAQRILLNALRKLLWQSGYRSGLIAELSHRSQKVTSYQWCWMHRPLQAARMIISRVYGAQQMANTHTMMARDLAIFLSLDRRLGAATLLGEGCSLPKLGEEDWEWKEPLTASLVPNPQLWDMGVPSPWAEAGSLIWRCSCTFPLWSLLLRMLR